MRFSRAKSAMDTTQYHAEGESFRYTAEREGKAWTLTIRRLETVGSVDPIRVAKAGLPFEEDSHDTLALCKAVATEFEALGDDYRSADHGHAERYTTAVLKAYADTTYGYPDVAGHQAPESANVPSVSNINQEETATMAETTTPAKLDITTEEGQAALEQINANIERVRSLAEAENVEAVKELTDETETIISNLTGKGNIKAKKDSREALKAAGLVQDKPKAEVAKAPVEGKVMDKTWDQYEGTTELVHMGAEKVAEGVKTHVKTSTLAKDVAAVIFDVWTRIPNKSNVPDIKGDSDAAKKASKALYAEAGKGFEETYDTKKALNALIRSVQDQRSDVRAEWLRSLDGDDDVAAERRALMATVLEGKPEDEKASEWVANVYGVSTIGQTEKRRLEWAEKKKAKELTGGNGGSGEGEGDGDGDDDETTETTPVDPDEYLTKTVDRVYKDLERTDQDQFTKMAEKASEAHRKAERERLEKVLEGIKAMIAATL